MPTISLQVLFFGAAREIAGANEIDFTVDEGATVAQLKRQIFARYPDLERFGRSLLVAVNEQYADEKAALHPNDEVAVFPPVSGGNDDEANRTDFYELTAEPINIEDVARRIVPPDCGATVTLDGYAREHTKSKPRTLYLVYEAYETMALREMKRICEAAHGLFDIAHIGIVHRTGVLEIGETSVVISVAAPHRRAAFEACEWLIKELKRTVPVWKKEFYEDGEIWVEGEGTNAPMRS